MDCGDFVRMRREVGEIWQNLNVRAVVKPMKKILVKTIESKTG